MKSNMASACFNANRCSARQLPCRALAISPWLAADAHVLHCGQHRAVALAGDDGAQDLLAGLPHYVRNDVGKLDVHLGERLLHVLHVPTLALQQHATLAPQCAQGAHGIRRTECTAEQAVGHELLQPRAVLHVGFATGDVYVPQGRYPLGLDVARVDQQHGEATRFQQFEQGNPVDAGGFHGDSVD